MLTTKNIDWQKAPKTLVLNDDQPDIWLVDLNLTLADGYISNKEHERLSRLSDPDLKARYRNSRLAMRAILSRYLRLSTAEIHFRYLKEGKPELAMHHQPLHFNLSHCAQHALFAVVKHVPVGIDIECTRSIRNYHSLARRIFSAADRELLLNTPTERVAESFYRLWTAMEARQKSFGHGIFSQSIEPDKVSQRAFSVSDKCIASIALALPELDICPRFMHYST